jgi:uncharacterized membrane protein
VANVSRTEVSERIRASRDEVWAVFTDLERAPQRVSGIHAVEVLTSGPMQLGTRWRETRTLGGRQATEELAVTAFEPPERYVVEAEARGARYRSEFRFRSDGDATEVTAAFEVEALGVLARIVAATFGRAAARSVGRAMADDLRDLKRALEA